MSKNNSIKSILATSIAVFAMSGYAQPLPAAPVPANEKAKTEDANDAAKKAALPAAPGQGNLSGGGFQSSSRSMSVDDLLRSGQLKKEEPKGPASLPMPNGLNERLPGRPSGSTALVEPSKEPVLMSIYKFAGNVQAQVEIGSTHRVVKAGDRLKDGWVVKSIAKDSLVMEKCAKKCTSKSLYLGDD
jgi:hypothetical protein